MTARLDDEKAMRAVITQLLHQAILPVQVILHGATAIVGPFIRALVTINQFGCQLCFSFQLQTLLHPGLIAAIEYIDSLLDVLLFKLLL